MEEKEAAICWVFTEYVSVLGTLPYIILFSPRFIPVKWSPGSWEKIANFSQITLLVNNKTHTPLLPHKHISQLFAWICHIRKTPPQVNTSSWRAAGQGRAGM